MNNLFADFFKDSDKNHHFLSAKLCNKLAKNIEQIMDEKKLSKSGLAELLSMSRPYITKLLSGDANLTIESLAKISIALDCDLRVDLRRKSHDIHLSDAWAEKWHGSIDDSQKSAMAEWTEIFKIGAQAGESESERQTAQIYHIADYFNYAPTDNCSAA